MLTVRTGYEEWIDQPLRRSSGEIDFGVLWRFSGADFPLWRVSWIANTGELYAKEQTTDRYIVLGYCETREQVEKMMAGYAERQRDLADWALVLRMRGVSAPAVTLSTYLALRQAQSSEL